MNEAHDNWEISPVRVRPRLNAAQAEYRSFMAMLQPRVPAARCGVGGGNELLLQRLAEEQLNNCPSFALQGYPQQLGQLGDIFR